MLREEAGKSPGFQPTDRIVVIKHFFSESEAHIYAARLKQADIPCFISNANIMTALPLGGGGGIGLHVREQDLSLAQRIVSQLDFQHNADYEENYRDADEAEIAYLKSLKEQREATSNWSLLLWLAFFFAFLLILRAFLRAAGIVESWRDYF